MPPFCSFAALQRSFVVATVSPFSTKQSRQTPTSSCLFSAFFSSRKTQSPISVHYPVFPIIAYQTPQNKSSACLNKNYVFLGSQCLIKHHNSLTWQLWLRYPNTKVWETCTPYFDKRNIHFYVNVCGFHITEFFNEKHPMPDTPDDFVGDGNEGMFAFKKQMRL